MIQKIVVIDFTPFQVTFICSVSSYIRTYKNATCSSMIRLYELRERCEKKGTVTTRVSWNYKGDVSHVTIGEWK